MQLSSNDKKILTLLTPKDLAVFLNVSNTTVYRIIESRKISFFKINGSIRFKQKDIEDYINNNRFEPIQ